MSSRRERGGRPTEASSAHERRRDERRAAATRRRAAVECEQRLLHAGAHGGVNRGLASTTGGANRGRASRCRCGERRRARNARAAPRAAAPGEQRDGDRPEERDDLLSEGTNDRPTASRARARVGVRERQHNAAWTRAAAAVSRRRPRPRRCLRCAVERSLPPKRRDRPGRAVSAARGSARASAWVAYLGPAPLFQSSVAPRAEKRGDREREAAAAGVSLRCAVGTA